MSQTNYLQIVKSGLQRTAGPYRCAIRDQTRGNMIRAKKRSACDGLSEARSGVLVRRALDHASQVHSKPSIEIHDGKHRI